MFLSQSKIFRCKLELKAESCRYEPDYSGRNVITPSENHNDNEENIVWKLLETEIDLSDSQKISWRLGPVPEEEKGYRYLTGLRMYPIHEKLQDYPYPVGLQGFLHSNHPQTSNSPALTWRDLSQHHRDFVWSPDFPKKQAVLIRPDHPLRSAIQNQLHRRCNFIRKNIMFNINLTVN